MKLIIRIKQDKIMMDDNDDEKDKFLNECNEYW